MRFNLAMLPIVLVGLGMAQVVASVPADPQPDAHALVLSLAAIFVGMALALNLVIRLTIVRPIRRMASKAERISTGHFDEPPFDADAHDDLAALGASFNRMRYSLEKALHMIAQESRW
ncbi:HAMP domain-containing protein [Ramlibacter sp. AW1]|uniref:HAMP domain-containing protein n=1 Tax=Ramlibacter aurantiacus TaxID=2801330 RepID=A0A937D7I8_9BURK|nr:HAMP domain-containing protein [Ramlibacter aurantiacus]MBL0422063.1 HAMP domain-containing protein [Ramlibacter aurantiacus]